MLSLSFSLFVLVQLSLQGVVNGACACQGIRCSHLRDRLSCQRQRGCMWTFINQVCDGVTPPPTASEECSRCRAGCSAANEVASVIHSGCAGCEDVCGRLIGDCDHIYDWECFNAINCDNPYLPCAINEICCPPGCQGVRNARKCECPFDCSNMEPIYVHREPDPTSESWDDTPLWSPDSPSDSYDPPSYDTPSYDTTSYTYRSGYDSSSGDGLSGGGKAGIAIAVLLAVAGAGVAVWHVVKYRLPKADRTKTAQIDGKEQPMKTLPGGDVCIEGIRQVKGAPGNEENRCHDQKVTQLVNGNKCRDARQGSQWCIYKDPLFVTAQILAVPASFFSWAFWLSGLLGFICFVMLLISWYYRMRRNGLIAIGAIASIAALVCFVLGVYALAAFSGGDSCDSSSSDETPTYVDCGNHKAFGAVSILGALMWVGVAVCVFLFVFRRLHRYPEPKKQPTPQQKGQTAPDQQASIPTAVLPSTTGYKTNLHFGKCEASLTCCVYKDPIIIAAQCMSIVAFFFSWGFWLTGLLGLSIFAMLQASWCRKLKQEHLETIVLFSFLNFLGCFVVGVYLLAVHPNRHHVDDKSSEAWGAVSLVGSFLWAAVGVCVFLFASGRLQRLRGYPQQSQSDNTGAEKEQCLQQPNEGSGDGVNQASAFGKYQPALKEMTEDNVSSLEKETTELPAIEVLPLEADGATVMV